LSLIHIKKKIYSRFHGKNKKKYDMLKLKGTTIASLCKRKQLNECVRWWNSMTKSWCVMEGWEKGTRQDESTAGRSTRQVGAGTRRGGYFEETDTTWESSVWTNVSSQRLVDFVLLLFLQLFRLLSATDRYIYSINWLWHVDSLWCIMSALWTFTLICTVTTLVAASQYYAETCLMQAGYKINLNFIFFTQLWGVDM